MSAAVRVRQAAIRRAAECGYEPLDDVERHLTGPLTDSYETDSFEREAMARSIDLDTQLRDNFAPSTAFLL
jgi:hypothetical protein